MKAVVFVGPTLPPQRRPADPGLWDWRPPLRQGDLYRAARERPDAIGIIDGYFEVVPTVWHKEILWAMQEGVHVFGAASIGALRAVELMPFGMQGVGRVYEDFRDGVLHDDDEVAVLHGPAELGYPPVTEALVDIRPTIGAAIAAGVLTPQLGAALIGIAKRLFYKERTYAAIFEQAVRGGLPSAALQIFADWQPGGRVDQKRQDAEAMLGAIRRHLAAQPGPLRVGYTLADTVAWQAARRLVR